MTLDEELAYQKHALWQQDRIIDEFLDENEKKFGCIDMSQVDYNSPVWLEYKSLIGIREKINNNITRITNSINLSKKVNYVRVS